MFSAGSQDSPSHAPLRDGQLFEFEGHLKLPDAHPPVGRAEIPTEKTADVESPDGVEIAVFPNETRTSVCSEPPVDIVVAEPDEKPTVAVDITASEADAPNVEPIDPETAHYAKFSQRQRVGILILVMVTVFLLPLCSTMSFPLIQAMAGSCSPALRMGRLIA
jgi:hypothetical protein